MIFDLKLIRINTGAAIAALLFCLEIYAIIDPLIKLEVAERSLAMADVLLKIVVGEQQHENREATSKKIVSYLLEQGVPGATVKRGTADLDDRGVIHYDLLEDSYFNDLPIIIESVLDEETLEKIKGGLYKMTEHGQIAVVGVTDRTDTEQNSHFIVKVYTREGTKLIKKDEYEKILELLGKHNAIWATVTKAVAGYGSDKVIHSQHVFSASEHLPLVIECVVGGDDLPLLLEELKEIVTEGAVFTAPVTMIINQ